MSREVLHHGDCLEVLRSMAECSIDACVTDPPYGLSFMGKGWDYDVPAAAVWREVFRVLKPGAHLLAFFGSRTFHRGVVQIEDAGFEIRDQIMWLYGSGFPKSHNLDGEWEGWGTALKPAHEPIVVARKPLVGTVAENVRAHGPGALNIDRCRVSTADDLNGGAYSTVRKPSESEWVKNGGTIHSSTGRDFAQPTGRWPANVIHDGSEEVLSQFPEASGQLADASMNCDVRKTQNVYGQMRRGRAGEASAESANKGAVGFNMKPGQRRLDQGSAARFFYCAKASKSDRDEGLTSPAKPFVQFQTGNGASGKPSSISEGRNTEYRNHHPTVKPTDLMRYLCRLVTPPGGLVLDPFMGSGSTGKAAMLEGFQFVGIEREADYIEIARARIAHAAAADESRQAVLL